MEAIKARGQGEDGPAGAAEVAREKTVRTADKISRGPGASAPGPRLMLSGVRAMFSRATSAARFARRGARSGRTVFPFPAGPYRLH